MKNCFGFLFIWTHRINCIIEVSRQNYVHLADRMSRLVPLIPKTEFSLGLLKLRILDLN